MNCENCKWLCFFDNYFCGNSKVKTNETAFIENIKIESCEEFKRRENDFILNKEIDF